MSVPAATAEDAAASFAAVITEAATAGIRSRFQWEAADLLGQAAAIEHAAAAPGVGWRSRYRARARAAAFRDVAGVIQGALRELQEVAP